MRIIGLDCATVDAKVGLALGVLSESGLEIQDPTLCTRERAAATVMGGWLRDARDAVLIAIDAPLGWPKPLAETLINCVIHRHPFIRIGGYDRCNEAEIGLGPALSGHT